MHTKCKKNPHGTGSNPVYKKQTKNFFLSIFLSLFNFFYFHSVVGACVLYIIINIFSAI